ncbi:Major facilitator superfamily [Globisporangium polare]
MVSFPIQTGAADANVAIERGPGPTAATNVHLLTKNERKERYMAKTRAEASYLFKYLIVTQMVVYLEAGAIPCLLDQLSVSLGMTATQQGALGGVVYLALSAASPLCAYFLHRFNPKHVLGLSLIFNNIAVLMLAFTPTGYAFSANMMIVARGLIGFTQAFPCVYTPLWVDEYAPREKVAGWMSYLQGSVPMGVMLGYFIGTVSNWVVPESFQLIETWRWPFVVQFVAMCPIMVAIFFVPKKHLIIRSDSDKSPTGSIASAASSDHSSALASTSDISDENRSMEIAEELMANGHGEDVAVQRKKSKQQPKSTGYVGPEAFFDDDEAEPLNLRHTISGDEALAGFPVDDAMVRGAPVSRSGFLHKEEEDVLLASAGMYGGSSQRGLRQLVQNHQNHFSASESDVGSSSFRRGTQLLSSSSRGGNGGPVDSDLETGENFNNEPLTPTSISIARLAATASSPTGRSQLAVPRSQSSSTYGAFDTSLRSPNNRSILDASILEEEFIEVYEQGSFSDGLYELAHIPIFCLIVGGLTAVYFVVTGVQYWSTIFMIKSLHASKYLVNGLFVVVAGTGPIFGVFYGGWLIDRYGGYIGVEQRAKSLGICMVLGITAFGISAVTTFFNDIYITAAFLWLLLFFGGSILPACTGIFISVVPAEHRALASSLSVMVFNLFGYSLSPYLTGLMMEWVLSHQGKPGSYFETCDEACAYRLGFRFCLFWSLWSFICIGSAYKLAKRQAEEARQVLEFYAIKNAC